MSAEPNGRSEASGRAPPAADEAPSVPLCRECGYDLRGHAIESLCPECGTPCRWSFMPATLEHASPDFLKTLCQGLTLCQCGVIAAIFCAPVAVLRPDAAVAWLLAASVIRAGGLWRLTARDPRTPPAAGARPGAIAARALGLADPIGTLGVLVMNPSVGSPAALCTVLGAAILSMLVQAACAYSLLRRLKQAPPAIWLWVSLLPVSVALFIGSVVFNSRRRMASMADTYAGLLVLGAVAVHVCLLDRLKQRLNQARHADARRRGFGSSMLRSRRRSGGS